MRWRFAGLVAAAVLVTACRDGRGGIPQARPTVRYLKGQLHLHSSRSSDSRTPPADVVRWYGERGYDFIVFTDHNRAGAPVRSRAPLVLAGVELTQNLPACTPPPEAGERCLFHVNAFLLDEEARPGFDPWLPRLVTDRRAAYRQALAAAEQLGGLAQVNHPNFHHGADAVLLTTLAREDGLRFFEVANGSFDVANQGDAQHPSTEAMWDQALTAGAWLFGTATDDAHHYYDARASAARGEPVYTGDRGFVMVRSVLERGAIREALLKGDFYASSGVLLDRVEVSGGALVIDVASTVRGPCRITFVGTGGRVLQVSEGRHARLSLASTPAGYVRAVVEDERHRKAWVEPIKVPLAGGAGGRM